MYAIKIVCKKVKSSSGGIIIPEDAVVYLVDGEWGTTTYSSFVVAGTDLLVWDTFEEADKAARKLTKKLHPWYIKAKSYEVVEVQPVYKVVGYELKES